MSILNLNNTDYTRNKTAVAIEQRDTDGKTSGTNKWYNSNWKKYFGYWKTQPDLQTAIILKTYWTVGLGYDTDIATETILNNITGNGKDTFQTILMNLDETRNLAGDSFAHIIWENNNEFNKRGAILNIKPLNAGNIEISWNDEGIIDGYEEMTTKKKFKPWQILHLTCSRLADEMHGTAKVEALDSTIIADNESFSDISKFAHNQAIGMILWKLKTDKSAEITTFKTAIANARSQGGSDLIIPDDDNAVTHDEINLSPSNFLLDWRAETRNRFYRAIMLPQIMPGAGGQGTESDSKVIYFGFEQVVKTDQLILEKDIEAQLGLKIKFIKPASMQPEMNVDAQKDGQLNVEQPQDTRM
jgi:hypothetical protein